MCVIQLPLLYTDSMFSCFHFLLFEDFFVVCSLLVNCKQIDNCFRLLTYLLQVSSETEYLKVTLIVVVCYHSYSVETETSLIDLLRSTTNFQYRLLRMLLCYYYFCNNWFLYK